MDIRKVLFVDDDRNILNAIRRTLADEPYECLFTDDGNQALEILEREEIHAIASDLCMPKMSGLELLKNVKDHYPHITRLVLSGNTHKDALLEAINQGEILRFIPKPWRSNEEFKTIVRQAIEYYDLHSEREMLMTFCEHMIDGREPADVNIRLMQAIISKRRRHQYEWREKCNPASQN